MSMPLDTDNLADWQRPAALPDLRHADLIALDTETSDEGLRADLGSSWAWRDGYICGISVAWHEAGEIRAVYIPLRHPDTDNVPRENVICWLADLFASGVRIVGQNLLYDLGWIWADFGIAMPPADRLEEIGALAAMIDENRRSYSLDNLCAWQGLPGKDEAGLRDAIEARLGIKPGVRKNKAQAYIAQLPARFVGPYAEQDAAATLALFEALNPILDQEGTRAAYRLECDLLPMVHEMRRRGVRISAEAAERGRIILLQKRDAVFIELADKLGRPAIDIDDLNHVPWLAANCDQLGITYPRTATGLPSFKAGPTGWLHRHPHWFPQLVHRARSYHKAAVVFLQQHVLGHVINGRIYPEIHPHLSEDNGTKSFRFSYSNPPLQQMPSHDEEITAQVRPVFLPEEGEMWATDDASQQEFRLIVHEAALRGLQGAREAAERYRVDPDTDFHGYVAEMTGLDRSTAKHANFAKAYGAGVPRFAATMGKPEGEAEAIYQRYGDALPFVHALSVLCQRQVERQGFLQLYDGARRHFEEWEARGVAWGPGTAPCAVEEARRRVRDSSHPWFGQRLQRVGAYASMNALIQGDAARHTKLWMRDCWREGFVPLLQMHDGLELSVASPEQAERVAQLGRDAVKLLVPMQVEIKYGRNWGDAKHAAWAEVPDAAPEAGPAVSYQPPPPVLATELASLVAPRLQDFVALDAFTAFVAERHAIYQRRQADPDLPRPWTDDPILQRWSFCNMYRHLDKTSAWIWDNWIRPHADDPDLWFAMLIARLINRIETLAALGYPVPWDPAHFIAVMQSRPKTKRYGSAYMLPAFKGDSRPKYVSQAERIFTPAWDNREQLRPRPGMTVAEFTRGLQAYPGMGKGFLAAQVAADTKRVEPLLSASDALTFALSGPGSREGMNYLLGRKADAAWRKNDRDWYPRLAELHAIIIPIYQDKGLPVPDHADLQNQTCEWSKYASISSGAKLRLKREYKPASDSEKPKAAKPAKQRKQQAPEISPAEISPAETELMRFIAAEMAAAEATAPPPEQPTQQASSPPGGNGAGKGHQRHRSAGHSPHGDSGAPRGQAQATWIYDHPDWPPPHFYLLVEKRIDATSGKRNFYQHHWANGRWNKGVIGTYAERKIPYQLGALKAALAADPATEVHIAEGEKDADTLRRLGFTTTTNPGGAEHWSDDLTAWLRVLGVRRIVLHEDNDKAGIERTASLAPMLSSFAAVRVARYLDVPDGEDITYWIETLGHTRAELEARIAAAEPATAADELGEWDAGELLSGPLPAPRQWLIAWQFCRSFLSGVVAAGDSGKTTLRLTQAIELATGRELLGLRVYGRCKVLVLSFEDDRAELHRRLLAICKHHNIDPAELKGWLFCRDLNGGAKLAELDAKGRKRQIGALDGMLRRAIARTGCGLVVLDPFVKLHALNESDNADMDFLCSALIRIAQDHSIAVDSPAHTHKGQIQAGDADARRGASAQRDAGRLDYTLTVMSEPEAEQFGTNPDERKRYMRLDKAKANIVRAVKARWFRLVSISLGNADAVYLDGDEVQAIEAWAPPEVWADAAPETLNAILDAIAAGLLDGRRYSDHSKAKGREAWQVVQKHCPGKPEAQCREMIRQWIKAGVLVEKDYDDPTARKPRKGLFLDPGKRPHY
jgi:DNA polymerase I-like protein with 3'-5' exonuclease and polymerase domains